MSLIIKGMNQLAQITPDGLIEEWEGQTITAESTSDYSFTISNFIMNYLHFLMLRK